MAVDHDKIRRILGEKEQVTDHALRAQSLKRALSGDVPKTLTPYEWEQWYADHGVPESHLTDQPLAQEAVSDKVTLCATWLGRAGLLPFVGLLLALYIQPQYQSFWTSALATYTLAIICFVVGAWWGTALIRRSAMALILSNTVVLVTFFGHLLLPANHFLLLGACLILVTLGCEKRLSLFQAQPLYYRRLRTQLTAVASSTLIVASGLV